MKNKINGCIDLRDVPNELIIAAYSSIGIRYWAGVDQLFNNQTALDEFKLVINPYNANIILDKTKEVIDSAALEIYSLAEKNPVVSDEYIKQHAETIKTAKHKINELNKIQKLHTNFYATLKILLENQHLIKEKKPLDIQRRVFSIIINEGNAVYVEHQNTDNNFNILYSESNHKKLVDNLINVLYASCENSNSNLTESAAENK